jgi:hypothetical protein
LWSNTYTQSTNTACAVPPSLLETLADCARQPAQPPSPFLDGRKSAASTARANMCAKRRYDWIPKVGKLPAPSRHRSPTLSQTVRASRHSPITVSPRPKSCPIDRPRKHGCKHRCDWIPKVGKLPAPSRHRSLTCSQTVRASRYSPITVSRWLKSCPIDRPRQHMCKRRCGRIPKVGKLPAPYRHRSLTCSQTVRASRHSPITVSRWSKIDRLDRPRQHVCKHRCDPITQDRQTARAPSWS